MCRRFNPGSHHESFNVLLRLFSFYMYSVHILYSPSFRKTYVGFTNDIERRMREHNFTESKSFTLRYRPWELIYTEILENKSDAMGRERFLKSGFGREEVKKIVSNYLSNNSRV
jgi:putative endonuclease